MIESDASNGRSPSKVLMLPLSRREAILALYAAVNAKRKKDIPESTWTQITLADGALD